MPNEIEIKDGIGRLGIIVGGGDLPSEIAKQATKFEIPIHGINLIGISGSNPMFATSPWFPVGSIGLILKSLKENKCKSICLAGQITRPDFSSLAMDRRAMRELPKLLLAAAKGDDALLRAIILFFENEGFQVVGPQEFSMQITGKIGQITKTSPNKQDLLDLALAQKVVTQIGKLDIGQGAVVCNGLVLAVEAQEGTDAMLKRCAQLPSHLLGNTDKPAGVLVKAPKPGQEDRIDLPTLGLQTVRLAAEAGLAGIGYTAGKSFLIDADAMCFLADKKAMFLVGLEDACEESE